MSALDQALLRVEQERRQQEGLPPMEWMHTAAPSRHRSPWRTAVVLVLMALGAGWWFGQHPAWWGGALPSNAPTPAQAPAAVPPTAAPAPPPSTDGEPGVAIPDWLQPGQTAWDNNRFEQASMAWLQALRELPPTTQALLLGQRLPLAAAMKRYLSWSEQIPTVMLQQSRGKQPTWMVLVVPEVAELESIQNQLQSALGEAVPWGQISHWVSQLEAVNPEPADKPLVRAPAPATATAAVPAPVPAAASAQVRPVAPKAAGSADLSAGLRPLDSPATTTPRESPSPQLVKEAPATLPAIETEFQKVEQLLARKQYKDAEAAVERLERDIGKTWRTRYLAGVGWVGMGRWDEAVLALGSALTDNPSHARIALYLAVSFQEQGQHAKAMQVLDEALKRHPDMPELWLNHGHSLQEQGLKEGAARSYRKFVELSADRTDLMVQRSWVLTWLDREGGKP